jgi:hypothetical protein
MPKRKEPPKKLLTRTMSIVEARKAAVNGIANLTHDAMRVLHDAIQSGDVKVAQWVVDRVLDSESLATVTEIRATSSHALPVDPAARAQALEGLRLIKQAERRS